ncbi:hypothetical protein ZWY2020_048132 [Hordeum vulgare]|nr:hypothetical protein ZWY2020_048132 [Hordeum vulgare]
MVTSFSKIESQFSLSSTFRLPATAAGLHRQSPEKHRWELQVFPLLSGIVFSPVVIGLCNLSVVVLLSLLIYGFKLGITGAAISTVAFQYSTY